MALVETTIYGFPLDKTHAHPFELPAPSRWAVVSCLLEDKGYWYDWTHIIGCVGHQVLFQDAPAIFISEGKRKYQK